MFSAEHKLSCEAAEEPSHVHWTLRIYITQLGRHHNNYDFNRDLLSSQV